jgi:geranylgeranyl diphosphate synthase type I
MGEAFQLRDDVLGAFGESSVTGKPVGDDLREGKPTPLVAIATARATAADRELLNQLGSADLTASDVAELQALFVRTGAVDDVEVAIERLVVEARDALAAAPLTETARVWLDELAAYVAWRDS